MYIDSYTCLKYEEYVICIMYIAYKEVKMIQINFVDP